MHRLLVVALLASACGDDGDGPGYVKPDPPTSVDDVIAKLLAIDGVTAVKTPTQTEGYDYVVVHFTQPVDHAHPDGDTFQMEASLLYHDGSAPMIVQTSGYWDYYLDNPVELTQLLTANQISIEHRYFASSRPANPDWTKLTIRQMADDEHAVIAALRGIFPGAFITTGASKGGMTSIYHRRFYPNDVDGTVPYVAPISFGAPDARYTPFLDTLGDATCRQAVRDVAKEMLANRRAAMLSRAMTSAQQNGSTFTRILIGPALEVSIESLEWAFWQYYGTGFCDQVPAITATDDVLYDFLDTIDPVTDSDDASTAAFDAYYYQASAQLGYPADSVAYLEPYEMYTDADFAGGLPTAEPPYDGGEAMHDIDDFVQHDASRLLFVYGQWDPWTGGAFTLGSAADSLKLVQAQGTHGSKILRLADGDRTAAFAKIEAWTGVTPVIPTARERHTREPAIRVPPVLRRLR